MLGNITLLMPLEKLYNSTFQKKWDSLLDKVRVTSPGDLEEIDKLVDRLEKLYDFSGVKKLSMSIGTYPDEYSRRINMLRSGMSDTIRNKFQAIETNIRRLIGDHERMEEYEADRKQLEEALVQFRLMRAFFRRWKLDTDKYKGTGSAYDFRNALKQTAYRLARKQTVLMTEYAARRNDVDFHQKTEILEGLKEEIGKTCDWYQTHYLNADWNNEQWSGVIPWMSVDYLDSDTCIAPLERLRKVPSDQELTDLQKVFSKFTAFYHKHSLVELNELGAIRDYNILKGYAESFSSDSNDPGERLKAGLMEQMLKLHRVVDDAKRRKEIKMEKEEEFKTSFAMYFAPIDEVYKILEEGFICSDGSTYTKASRHKHKSLVFHINADIKDGDIGFIFPVTKVIQEHMFYQVSTNNLCDGTDFNDELHVMNRNIKHPVRIDIRNGIFIAPRNKTVSYEMEGKAVRETTERYFTRFFTALAHHGSKWFDASRLHNWLSRHCVFYEDKTRMELLNMLRNRYFVNVMNHFTNKRFDNLSLAPIEGHIVPAEFYVQHRFENVPQGILPSEEISLSLFEWMPEQE